MQAQKEQYGQYALIWFEGDDLFTMVDHNDKTVLLDEEAAAQQSTGILKTQDDVDRAEDDLRYAITTQLLEDLYGWTP